MAAKKYYAVKKGKITGIFDNWDSCRESVDGFPGAEYKGFSTLEEAEAYLGTLDDTGSNAPVKTGVEIHASEQKEKVYFLPSDTDELVAYVDGSYEDSIKRYAFGCVFLVPDGRIFLQYGSGNNEQSLQHRNVTGEMLGAMYAVRTAILGGYRRIQICYDYEGIEKWVTGVWRAKQELTAKYAESMRKWGQSIQIRFTKVPAHSNVTYNELADQTAKRGLVETDQIPKVIRIEEMMPL
ncbi:MAG: viroplasmin family protein [Acetatifactor sp.]